jgi:hypothetical protein
MRSLKDPCIMYLHDGDFKISVGTHVDDLLFTTTDTQRLDNWFKTLKFTFGTASLLTKEVTKFVSFDFSYDMNSSREFYNVVILRRRSRC